MVYRNHNYGQGNPTETKAFEQLSFLTRSPNRTAVLRTLYRAPHDRHELETLTEVPRPTLARILGELEERGWVERENHEYETTVVGELVVAELLRTLRAIATVHRLRQLLVTVPSEVISLDIEALSEATLTVAEPGSPFRPVKRFGELIQESTTLRDLNKSFIGHLCHAELAELLDDGGSMTVVYEPEVVDSMLSATGDAAEAVRTGAVRVFVHEALPFGLSLFDERVALAGYDPATGALTTLVDTDSAEVRRWATGVYETYRADAVEYDELGSSIPEPRAETAETVQSATDATF